MADMTRNPAGYMQEPGRHTRHSTERNGKFVRGPKRGRKGVARGGRLKRSR